MIEKLNIPIENKLTKKISYGLNLDDGWWYKYEHDSRGNVIYFEDSEGDWYKREYDSIGNKIYYETSSGYWSKREYASKGEQIYYETSNGIIKDDR